MSRTPASYSMPVVRGSTWEEDFTYVDSAGAPVDLTGYEARMQVRTVAGRYGTSTADTLVMELTTGTGELFWDTAAEGQLRLKVDAAATLALNPSNLKKVKLVYSIEVYLPAGADPEYVIPLVEGAITVMGEVTR